MQHNNEKLSPATIKLIIISTIVIVIIVIVGIVVSNILNQRSQNDQDDHNDVDYDTLVDELPETSEPPVLLQNFSFLTNILGSKGTTAALNIVSDAIVEYNGMPKSGESYVGTVLSKSLIKDVSFPYSTCNFIVSVSNEKSYNIQIASESQWYYGLIIRPMPLNNANKIKLYIVFNEQESEATYLRDDAVNGLTKWAKNIHSGPLTITTKDNY